MKFTYPFISNGLYYCVKCEAYQSKEFFYDSFINRGKQCCKKHTDQNIINHKSNINSLKRITYNVKYMARTQYKQPTIAKAWTRDDVSKLLIKYNIDLNNIPNGYKISIRPINRKKQLMPHNMKPRYIKFNNKLKL